MSEVVWKNLAKDIGDLTKISDEIDSKLGAHNVDESAHSQSNEAIYNHRVGEILDHLDEAVVNTKIKAMARSSVAIVDVDGEGDFTDIQDAVDYAITKGGGIIRIKRGVYYPTDDIILGKTVDLVGDGVDETIIDFGGLEKGIIGYKKFTISDRSFEVTTWTNGSKIVIFSAGTKILTDDGPIWPGMRIYHENEDKYYTVESVDSETQLTVTASFTGVTGDSVIYTDLLGTWTNGSKIVTFPAGSKLITDGVLSIMRAYAVDGGTGELEIASVDSETQLTLVDNNPGSSGEFVTYLSEYYPPNNILKGFTIRDTIVDWAIDLHNKVDCYIEQIKWLNCKGLVKFSTNINVVNYIRRTSFYDCSGPVLFSLVSYNVENNYGEFSDENVIWLRRGNNVNVKGNWIKFKSKVGSTVFDSVAGYFFAVDNKFTDFEIFDELINHGVPYTYGMRLLNNYIQAKTGFDIDITFRDSIITGNYLYTSSPAKLHLVANSNDVEVIGNYCKVAPVNDGVNNEVVHNVID